MRKITGKTLGRTLGRTTSACWRVPEVVVLAVGGRVRRGNRFGAPGGLRVVRALWQPTTVGTGTHAGLEHLAQAVPPAGSHGVEGLAPALGQHRDHPGGDVAGVGVLRSPVEGTGTSTVRPRCPDSARAIRRGQ